MYVKASREKERPIQIRSNRQDSPRLALRSNRIFRKYPYISTALTPGMSVNTLIHIAVTLISKYVANPTIVATMYITANVPTIHDTFRISGPLQFYEIDYV